jgi:prophage regulatory protein
MSNPKYHHRVIRLNEVKILTGLSRSSIYKKAKLGEFPRPITLGSRSVGWVEQEVINWIIQRITYSRQA